MPPPPSAATPTDAQSQWLDKMAKKFPSKPAKLSEATVDATFNDFWRILGRKQEKIQEALKRTREQIGPPMPANYVPPPLRNKASPQAADPGRPGPYVEDLDPQECVESPETESEDPDGEQVCREDGTSTPENGTCEDPSAGAGAKPKGGADPSLTMEQSIKDLPGGLTLTIKVGTEGGEVELVKKNAEPIAKTLNVYPGVYLEAAVELKAGIAGKVSSNTWEVNGGIGAELAVTLRGGLQEVASVGGGFKVATPLQARISGTYTTGPLDLTVTDGGIHAELNGSLIINATLDVIDRKLEYEFGKVNLLKVTWEKANGWDLKPGSDIKQIADALDALSSDPTTHPGWSPCGTNDGASGNSGAGCEEGGGQGGQGGSHG